MSSTGASRGGRGGAVQWRTGCRGSAASTSTPHASTARTGRALESLPHTTAAFARGELSYSKVRALTRISEPEAEGELVEFAKVATAAQVEKTVSAYRTVVRNVDPDRAHVQQAAVGMKVRHNDDGTVTITATLTPDAAVQVLDALDAARKELRRERRGEEHPSRADALERLAVAYTQPDAHRPAPTEIIWHTDEAGGLGADARHGVFVSAETVRRLACDARVRRIRDDGDTSCDQGRAHRNVNRAMRRRLVRRDGDQCRFPGCAARHYLHAHHIWHWIDGGPTDLANLVLLCSHHHKLVHDGAWHVAGDANQPLHYTSPQGRTIAEDEPRRAIRAHWRNVPFCERHIGGKAIRTASGERLDLHLTISALCCVLPPDRK